MFEARKGSQESELMAMSSPNSQVAGQPVSPWDYFKQFWYRRLGELLRVGFDSLDGRKKREVQIWLMVKRVVKFGRRFDLDSRFFVVW